MTTNTGRAVAAIVAATVLGATLAAAGPALPVFGVAVLRRDGILVPFAAFNGKRWVDNWPLPHVDLSVPISLRDLPSSWWGPTGMLESWQAWVAPQPQSLHVVQPDWINVHCTRQVGLRTNYAAPAPPPRTVQPYPKDGLAVSPPQPVETIAVITAESEDMRQLIPAVHEAFNKAERQIEDRVHHPVQRRAREGRLPDIEAVYAAGDHPRIYYVEAARRYRVLGQGPDECEAMAFGTGWFARDGAELRSLETAVDLLNCDRRGASYMLPLGVMTIAGTRYWLAQFSGWAHERYVVVEVKPKSVKAVINVWGGSC